MQEESPTDRGDLTKERSLYEVFKEGQKLTPPIKSYLAALVPGGIILIYAFFVTHEPRLILTLAQETARNCLVLSLNMLALFLTGFGVYLTLVRERMLIAMTIVKHKKSGLPYIKHNVLNFVVVLIYYLVFSVFCFLISTALSLPRPYFESEPAKYIYLTTGSCFCWIVLSITISGFFFLLIQLKSLIFNSYHAYMSSARWLAEGWETDKPPKESS